MISGFARSRRCVLAACALALSALIFRSQIADALVVRGDEALYRSRTRDALAYYSRAVWFDRDSGVAVDRFAFVAMASRDAVALPIAVAIASGYLRRHGRDGVVLMDRAMAYRTLGDARAALTDFIAAANAQKDARAYAFAGDEARRTGDRHLARTMWRAALALSPGLPIAAHGLARLGVR